MGSTKKECVEINLIIQLVKIWLYGKHFVELLQLQIVGLEWIDANGKDFLD
jgi:hypothetical protein